MIFFQILYKEMFLYICFEALIQSECTKTFELTGKISLNKSIKTLEIKSRSKIRQMTVESNVQN